MDRRKIVPFRATVTVGIIILAIMHSKLQFESERR